MPKDTFLNLSDEKKQKILNVLKKEFQTKPYYKVNVKTIVEELKIARGSFYQYFENLEDSYFTILDQETIDIHLLFTEIFLAEGHDLHKSLIAFGKRAAEILFDQEHYMIYKNRYLYWNEDLDRGWRERFKTERKFFKDADGNDRMDPEQIRFIKSVVHDLIKRIFQEEWSKEEFLQKYEQHIFWIEKGVR